MAIAIRAHLDALNNTIRTIHHGAHVLRLSTCAPLLLDEIRPLVAFDTAWWGWATQSPPTWHALTAHGNARTSAAACQPGGAHDDFLHALLAQPGLALELTRTIPPGRWKRSQFFRHHVRPHGLADALGNALGVSLAEPSSALHFVLILWRRQGEPGFGPIAARSLTLLMPHLLDTQRILRRASLLPAVRTGAPEWALCNPAGWLFECSQGFLHTLRSTLPGWPGLRLPDALVAALDTEAPCSYAGKTYLPQTYLHQRSHGVCLIQQLPPHKANRLSAREREIVLRYADGATYLMIATELGLAPATVRSHLARSYQKLGVNNKVDLVNCLLRSA
jgi:DNA-binding CsgD family transcriptional regulator